MKITVSVTQEDIDLGCKRSRTHCMVHRALTRASEGALAWVEVAPNGLYDVRDGPFIKTEHGLQQVPPFLWFDEDIREKLVDWDQGLPTEPFSFDIDFPIEAVT